MNSKTLFIIVLVVLALTGLVFLLAQTSDYDPEREYSLEESRQIAETWMQNESPTYTYDGSDLQLLAEDTLEEGKSYQFGFEFQSSSAGYGDRTGEMTAQVITDHVTRVVVDAGQVVEAVTDEVYSELEARLLGDEISPTNDVPEEAETMTLQVYFLEDEELFSVERQVPQTQAVARAALEELLSGPTQTEQNQNIGTEIPVGVSILQLEIENGIARVDFSSELDDGVAGSARVTAIRGQIENTLLQFESVNQVEISVEGRTEDILQP